jgi:hypothetical protein
MRQGLDRTILPSKMWIKNGTIDDVFNENDSLGATAGAAPPGGARRRAEAQ